MEISDLAYIICITLFPLLTLIYAYTYWRLRNCKVDTLCIVILVLYIVVIFTKFLCAFAWDDETDFLITVICAIVIWVVQFIFVSEMQRVGLVLKCESPEQYFEERKKITIIKWIVSCAYLLSGVISIIVHIMKTNEDRLLIQILRGANILLSLPITIYVAYRFTGLVNVFYIVDKRRNMYQTSN
jgi:hypothetical protein